MEVGTLVKQTEEHLIIDNQKVHIIRKFIYNPERVKRGYELLREATT